jgi:hypothetical protein
MILFILFCVYLKHLKLLNGWKKNALTFLFVVNFRITSWIMADWFPATNETKFLTANVKKFKGRRPF